MVMFNVRLIGPVLQHGLAVSERLFPGNGLFVPHVCLCISGIRYLLCMYKVAFLRPG